MTLDKPVDHEQILQDLKDQKVRNLIDIRRIAPYLTRRAVLKSRILTFTALLLVLFPTLGFAQNTGDWLPQSGVKSPYSPQEVPTTLKPVPDSLASLLAKGYRITTTAYYGGAGALFTLTWQTQTMLCVLTAPNPGTDQNVPTSRCWSLN